MQWVPKNIGMLSDYWNGLAGGETPDRAQFQVEDVQPLLPFLMLCDFEINPFRLRYRLSGTRVDEMTGMNLAGRYLDEFADGVYAEPVREMLAYYEEASRTGRPRVWNYAWAGNNPNLKLIWAGMFPLKVNGRIAQCIAIEDYGEYNAREDGRIEPVDPATRRDWARLHRD
ncbi:MAG TPA: PAS domain-containing protein [Dongiaceae bacterium]|jgi:hypothetical protein|nr:PAS domain-containing protein [Dongiaceae bacterium]